MPNVALIVNNILSDSGVDLSVKADLVAGKIPSTQLPSYVDDVLEYANLAGFPETGETGKIYVALDTNETYRWSGSAYVRIANGAVQSVNTLTGAVTLTTSNIAEGTNLYYTEARVNANTNVALNTAARHNAVTIGTANGLSLATQVLSLGLASNSTAGALSATDWNTFNSKQAALSGTGFVRLSGTTITYVTGSSFQFVKADGSLDANTYLTSVSLSGYVTGSGTTNYVPKFTGISSIGNSIIYDGGSSIGINTSSPYDSTQFKLDVNGGLIVKNSLGVPAQFVLINSDPAAGGFNGFMVQTVGGNTATTFGQIQTYYGTSIASGALRLQPYGGSVGIGTTSPSAPLHVYTSGNTVTKFEGGSGYSELQLLGSFGTSSVNYLLSNGSLSIYAGGTEKIRLTNSGQLRFITYTSSSAWTGTAVATLGVDSSGNVITVTGGGGSSQWITSGSDIYYSTGRVGIGSTGTPLTNLDVRLATTDNVNGTVLNSYPIASFIANGSGGGQRGLQIGAPTGSINSPVFLKVFGTSARFAIVNQSNVENFTVLEGGSVGIGIASPVTNLHIASNTNTGIRINATASNGSAEIDLLSHGTQNAFIDYGPNQLRFRSTNSDMSAIINQSVLVLQNDGNVGIGTTSPNALLNIVTTAAGEAFIFRGSGSKEFVSINHLGFIKTRASDTNGANMHFFDNGGSKRMEMAVGSTAMTWYSDALAANFITFQHTTGNIGLSVANPGVRLDVSGAIRSSTSVTAPQMYGTSYSTLTSGAGTGTAVFDTLSTTGAGAYEVVIVANPNAGGSSSYADWYIGKLVIGTGFNGSAVVHYIDFIQQSPMPRTLFGSGGGDLTVTAVFNNSGTESEEASSGATYTIRFRISGYNSSATGANTTIYLKKIGT